MTMNRSQIFDEDIERELTYIIQFKINGYCNKDKYKFNDVEMR